ncbi:D-Ala-D-Ala carboxypeptidase family metallohydrolase [Fusobacterium ulcerans]|uniref:D-Ala-D-Ala carboxypeptidase family metallohydrolase n=1 Tax=Fusobacterium ulcerans TaxID=861 RepID=UPI001D0B47EB|nr:D-Ala-D-Ala carboxypeptidase family metallohydrolase [Fusobacterium ulcerans]MCB8563678.1 D-Ala-D-Ala carboxypeptidase family metallohydrolase [Fusobacterium ulcerans]MCB8647945.1 D-Ala-D-Ala carboxypeptidase family metallohydrolase [Fusobacterium ulcerans]
MKISKYFTERETTVSAMGEKLKIKNIPNQDEKDNILYTASRMDVIREYLGVSLIVLSWFRCEELNTAVKGSKTSAHRFGMAVDIYSTKISSEDIYNKLIEAQAKGVLQFDQLIYYPKQNFVHIGFKLNKAQERNMCFVSK